MTTSNMAYAADAPKSTKLEEISIIIAAQDLTPTMMSYDFLKFSGIIPKEWELSGQPVLSPNVSQLSFTNGIGINAQPRSINISESLGNKKTEDLAIAAIASNYIEKLPHAEYMGYSFSPKILIPFPSTPDAVREYITGTLLGSGSWKRIGRVPLQAGINLMYLLDRCQLTMNISEARLQQPQQAAVTAILFAGNFNYSVNPNRQQEERIAQIKEHLEYWQTDLSEFREIVNQKFLDSSENTEQSIGETTLFPGQTL